MNQADDLTLFIHCHQACANRDHVFGVQNIVFVQFSISGFHRESFTQLLGGKLPFGTRDPRNNCLRQLAVFGQLCLYPLDGVFVGIAIGFVGGLGPFGEFAQSRFYFGFGPFVKKRIDKKSSQKEPISS
jgi:hypothetical protein